MKPFLSRRKNGIYYIWYQLNGTRKKKSTKTRKYKKACKCLKDFREEYRIICKQEHFNPANQKHAIPNSFEEFKKRYLLYSSTKHSASTQDSYRWIINIFMDMTEIKSLNDLTPDVVQNFIIKLQSKNLSYSTIRTYLVTLDAIFNVAKKWMLIINNPVSDFVPKNIETEIRCFSDEEIRTLISNIEIRWLKNLVILAYNTGLRLGEVVNLHWRSVDIQAKLLTIFNTNNFTTKSKRSHTIPLNRDAIQALEQQQLATMRCCTYVYCNKHKVYDKRHVSRKFKEYILSAGLDSSLHFHCIRHTFATKLLKSGATIFEVSRLLNHNNIKTTMKYAHYSASQMHDVLNKLCL